MKRIILLLSIVFLSITCVKAETVIDDYDLHIEITNKEVIFKETFRVEKNDSSTLFKEVEKNIILDDNIKRSLNKVYMDVKEGKVYQISYKVKDTSNYKFYPFVDEEGIIYNNFHFSIINNSDHYYGKESINNIGDLVVEEDGNVITGSYGYSIDKIDSFDFDIDLYDLDSINKKVSEKNIMENYLLIYLPIIVLILTRLIITRFDGEKLKKFKTYVYIINYLFIVVSAYLLSVIVYQDFLKFNPVIFVSFLLIPGSIILYLSMLFINYEDGISIGSILINIAGYFWVGVIAGLGFLSNIIDERQSLMYYLAVIIYGISNILIINYKNKDGIENYKKKKQRKSRG